MIGELPLVSTVAVGLGAAFLCGLAAAKLRVSPIVGYLLAGILVGRNTPGFVADMQITEELSEIGIVLLMFGVGLHFSMTQLMLVRRIAVTGALVRIAIVTGVGVLLAQYWGWDLESGLLFGLALSVASTVVLLRAVEEQNLGQSLDARIAIGWLIVEDLIMVLVLVLIPALAVQEQGESSGDMVRHLGIAFGKVALFIAVMLVAGKRFLPWLLSVVAGTGSRELFTLAVFSVAVGFAFCASVLFGVSLALGAFFAGMMIRESDLNHAVADRALPFQDAFAVLFFVSVGMLFNPMILLEKPFDVLLISAVIMAGKALVSFLIVMAFGYTLRSGLKIAAGLSQIGEFSFILVTLGLSHGLMPEDGRDLILAGAIISIAFNPLMFRAARLLYSWAERVPVLSRHFNMREDDLSDLRGDEKQALRDLVILVGHGRVGKHISRNIQAARINLVIIDQNRERVETLRSKGHHAIAGDANQADVLEKAAIQKAAAIVLAIPDPFEIRNIVETARSLKPGIRVLVRAHNDAEISYFTTQGVNLVVTGPEEVGRRMAEYLNFEMKRA